MLSDRCLSCPVCDVGVLGPNGWTDQDETWHADRPRPWLHCVRWGPSPLPKKGAQPPPQFSVHVHCDQMAGWIKVALGTEVGLGPRHIVLDGDPALLLKKAAEAPPIFGPLLLWPNGCMHQDASWYGGRPQPRRLCVRWGPSPPPQKGVEPPIFGPCPTSIVAKRLHGLRRRLIRR